MRLCERCGASLEGRRRDARYCSLACKRRPRTQAQREARNAAQRERYASDPEWRRRVLDRDRTYRLGRLYGLGPGEFACLENAQGGRCAICRREDSAMHVDHDHATGHIRGLLCLRCNTGLGALGDSADAIRAALAYLEKASAAARMHSPD